MHCSCGSGGIGKNVLRRRAALSSSADTSMPFAVRAETLVAAESALLYVFAFQTFAGSARKSFQCVLLAASMASKYAYLAARCLVSQTARSSSRRLAVVALFRSWVIVCRSCVSAGVNHLLTNGDGRLRGACFSSAVFTMRSSSYAAISSL